MPKSNEELSAMMGESSESEASLLGVLAPTSRAETAIANIQDMRRADIMGRVAQPSTRLSYSSGSAKAVIANIARVRADRMPEADGDEEDGEEDEEDDSDNFYSDKEVAERGPPGFREERGVGSNKWHAFGSGNVEVTNAGEQGVIKDEDSAQVSEDKSEEESAMKSGHSKVFKDEIEDEKSAKKEGISEALEKFDGRKSVVEKTDEKLIKKEETSGAIDELNDRLSATDAKEEETKD
ncbi:hypothetical protein B0J14DRAFT_654195 [Halenospora varia]|nr:hypothetical protein B0J14DRAFT_654195 [Halenospora varia]